MRCNAYIPIIVFGVADLERDYHFHVQRTSSHYRPRPKVALPSSGHNGAQTGGRRVLRAPPFFTSQGEKGSNGEFFLSDSEAEPRISFFAQSLTTDIPQPQHVDAMPMFAVLTPHYSEKVKASFP